MNGWDAYRKLNRTVAQGATSFTAGQATAAQVRRGSRGARRGYLVPGDAPPVASAGGGYQDYRGVLDPRRIPDDLAGATFPLGRFVSPSRGVRGPIGLPESVVAHHVALVGRTGAGKTTSIIVPWMLAAVRAGWSVVAIDVMGDLLDDVQRAHGGPLPAGLARELSYVRPNTSLHWNWLAELDSDRAVDNAVAAVLGRKPPTGVDPFFYNQDGMILRGLLEVVMHSKRPDTLTTSTLLSVLRDQDRLGRVLSRSPSQQARSRLSTLVNEDPTTYLRRINGVATALDPLARGAIEQVSSRMDFRAQDILDNPLLLSVVAPMQDERMGQMFSTLLINQLLFRAYARFSGNQGVPILLVLDEAAEIADRIDIERILSVARAAGVAVLFAVQDARQFKDDNERSIVFANAGTVICLQGVSQESASVLSKRVGMHPVASTSTSQGPYQRGAGRGPSLTTSTAMAPILGENEIMHPPFGGRLAAVHALDLSSAPFFVDLERGHP